MVGLPSGPQLASKKTPRGLRLPPHVHGRLDGHSSRRHLVEKGEVQVSVQGQREAPGDGRRRHDEDVGVAPFIPEGRALHHAETLLLVDHRETQGLEPHVRLNERVCPDDQGDGPLHHAVEQVRPLPFLHAPGEKPGAHAQGVRPAPNGCGVLLGQNLRRGQQDRLMAALNRR